MNDKLMRKLKVYILGAVLVVLAAYLLVSFVEQTLIAGDWEHGARECCAFVWGVGLLILVPLIDLNIK